MERQYQVLQVQRSFPEVCRSLHQETTHCTEARLFVGRRIVRFWYRDKKVRRRVDVQCSPEEFVERWSQHIPERYRHAVRSFGLFAPRSMQKTFDSVFAILGQERRPRPRPRRWAESIKRDFGRHPLLDSKGKRMRWVRRIAPRASC